MGTTPGAGLLGGECRRRAATGGTGRAQLTRLFRLIVVLQSERFPNTRDLAESCEVSRRTIYRDLEALEAAGIPVHYRQERQGYQIARGFFLPPTNLSGIEALALTVLTRQWDGGDALGLLRHAREGAAKVVQALPADLRERVLAAGETFLPGSATVDPPEDRRRVHGAILDALTRQRQLRLWYHDPLSRVDECTKFSLYRLLLHEGHWFLVGRSSLRRRVEVIAVPWVRRAEATEDRLEVPPRFRLDRFLAHSWGVERSPLRYRVWLRFSARLAPMVLDGVWHPSQRRSELADGRVDLHFVVNGLGEILRWVLGFGDDVEVLAPGDLRDRLFEVATKVARTHEPSGAVPPPPATA
jgi:proteasome accessory factor B